MPFKPVNQRERSPYYIIEVWGREKCLAPSTRILDAHTGAYRPVSDLLAPPVVASLDTVKLQATDAEHIYTNGLKQVYTIRTQLGHELTATANHPVLEKSRGWQELRELRVGDKIAVAATIPFFGTDELPEPLVELVAFLLGDGYMPHLAFTNADPIVLDRFSTAAEELQGRRAVLRARRGKTVTLAATVARGRPNPLQDWLKHEQILHHRSPEKYVSPSIFRLSKKLLSLFLNRLITCDGWISFRNEDDGRVTSLELGYSSASKRLALDVQHLLLRYGIATRLYPRRVMGRPQQYWTVITTNRQAIQIFAEEIGLLGEKNRRLNELVTNLKTYTSRIKRPSGLHREGMGDILWDPIISKREETLRQPTYDLSVPEGHSFIANNILVHNSGKTRWGMTAPTPVYLYNFDRGYDRVEKSMLASSDSIPIVPSFAERHAGGLIVVTDYVGRIKSKDNKGGLKAEDIENAREILDQFETDWFEMVDNTLVEKYGLPPGGTAVIDTGTLVFNIAGHVLQKKAPANQPWIQYTMRNDFFRRLLSSARDSGRNVIFIHHDTDLYGAEGQITGQKAQGDKLVSRAADVVIRLQAKKQPKAGLPTYTLRIEDCGLNAELTGEEMINATFDDLVDRIG